MKILVIGSGISGLSAAIEAASGNQQVILASSFTSERAQSVMAAGGINAAAHVDGLKPLSREAWIAMKPDVVVITHHSLPMVGGSVEAFAQRPELKDSPAAKQKHIVALSASEAFSLDLNSPKVIDKLHAIVH